MTSAVNGSPRKTALVLPDQEAFLPKPTPTSATSVSPSKFRTPPRPIPQTVKQTPSPITPSRVALLAPHVQASPVTLKEPCDYHDVDDLFKGVTKKQMKGFKNKKVHTVTEESPTKRIKSAVLTQPVVSQYFLTVSKALEQDPTEKFPPLQVSADTQVHVREPHVAKIKHSTGVERAYGVHRNGDRASLYPKSGHNTYTFKKDSPGLPSPSDIPPLVIQYRSLPTTPKASEYFQQEYEKLTPPPKDGSSS